MKSSTRRLLSGPWAIEKGAFVEFVQRVAAAERDHAREILVHSYRGPSRREIDGHEIQSLRITEQGESIETCLCDVREGVAVIGVKGVLERSESWYSWYYEESTYDRLTAQVREAAERSDVRAIVFDVDSPGGDALGLDALAEAIRAARAVKPVDAVVRGYGASAAYFIASAAQNVFAERDALTGSIGTVMTLFDWSKFDAKMGLEEINIIASQSPKKWPDPTTEAGYQQLQAEVDSICDVFVNTVATNRGVAREVVLERFGKGAVFVGAEAIDVGAARGLVDGITTLDQVVAARAAGEPVQFDTQ